MGDNLSIIQNKNQQYVESLHFVQLMDDTYFGSIQVFRLKNPPYEYIMDYKKTFMEGDDAKLNKYLSLMSKLGETQHKNLAKIHMTETKQEIHMCIKDKKVHTYCNYYNFTLFQAIKKKKVQQSIFPQSQLIYIMNCLVDLALYLKKYNIAIGEYHSKKIYVSPEGYIKMYLLQIDQKNRHSCYYKALSEKQTIQDYILAPQQLTSIMNMEYQTTYDLYKADLFAIAMIILELITLDNPKFYYENDKSGVKIDRIMFDLDTVSKYHSQQFISLLKACMKQNPKQRCTLEQAMQMLTLLKKNSSNCSYCIRLVDDQQKKRKSEIKQSTSSTVRSPKFLSGVEKRLTPSPITTLSSSTSSNFKGTQARNSAKQFGYSTGSSFGYQKQSSINRRSQFLQ